MDITKPNKINPEILEALNPNKQEVSVVALSDRVMPANVKEVERHYHILFKDGGMYLQRKHVLGATDNPLSFQEIIIIRLCETILVKQA